MVKVKCEFFIDEEMISKEELKFSLADNNLWEILRNKIIDECFRETSNGHKLLSVEWSSKERNEPND